MHRLLLVAIVVGFILGGSGFAPSSARAYHTYEERLLDSTAYSLQRRRVRLGLFKLSYGIIDQLQVTTYTMPWLLGLIFEDVAPNIELKSTFYNRKRLALSASLGFLSGTIEQVEGVESTKVRYFLTPASLAASVRINSDVSTHIGGIFTGVSGDVDTSPGANDIAGSTVVDILQFWGMVEWRLSRVVAFTFTVRWVPWVSDIIVRGSLDSENPDIGIGLTVELIDLTNTFAVIPGFVFSWKRTNIRLGVGYGDFFVQGFALVVPRDVLSGVSPEFDVFVRF
ncbi:MAG: hypothetical protein JRG67_14925 [Deltaproteobacteria bacterium]|nr:hypothetical protein [Deltaproteobacteria bacterium]MBW2627704.1 hypothetical protein [Deltaproteobacteria bacterium]